MTSSGAAEQVAVEPGDVVFARDTWLNYGVDYTFTVLPSAGIDVTVYTALFGPDDPLQVSSSPGCVGTLAVPARLRSARRPRATGLALIHRRDRGRPSCWPGDDRAHQPLIASDARRSARGLDRSRSSPASPAPATLLRAGGEPSRRASRGRRRPVGEFDRSGPDEPEPPDDQGGAALPAAASEALLRGQKLHLAGNVLGAIQMYEAGLGDESASASDRGLLRAWLASACFIAGDVARCRALATEALEIASDPIDDRIAAAAHTSLALAAALAGDRQANATHYGRALEHAEAAGDQLQIARVRGNRGAQQLEEGEFGRALESSSTRSAPPTPPVRRRTTSGRWRCSTAGCPGSASDGSRTPRTTSCWPGRRTSTWAPGWLAPRSPTSATSTASRATGPWRARATRRRSRPLSRSATCSHSASPWPGWRAFWSTTSPTAPRRPSSGRSRSGPCCRSSTRCWPARGLPWTAETAHSPRHARPRPVRSPEPAATAR